MARASRHLVAGSLLTALALALTACGGSGSKSDKPLTHAQYIAKADGVCTASNARTRTLNEQLARAAAGTTSNAQLLRRLAPILRRGYAPIAANARTFDGVAPPVADAVAIERIRETYDQQAELVRRLAIAAEGNDADRFKSLSLTQKDVVARARRLARAFGFKQCASTKSDAGAATP
ncbi:MAG TPA: hypothetical protein VGF63_13945 [Solirubrobacteraceae bacterium]|jgi:hypothetical protein